jgi:1,4-dihydroxy-2-naphthoate polyprenyltransferase
MNPWIKAARPKTLPLAATGILLGSAIAYNHHLFQLTILISGLTTAILLQILSNFANDYGDFKKGTDALAARKDRMLTNGEISEKSMLKAIWIVVILTFISGITLLMVSGLRPDSTFILYTLLGIISIAAAIKYTMGKFAYAYKGLGDLFVFIFFGLVAVCGIFYLYTGVINLECIFSGIGLGLLATAVLNINNIRDIDSDKLSGKITIPVRLGISKAEKYHTLLCIVGSGFIILTFLRLLQAELIKVPVLEYIMVIAVFFPSIILLIKHQQRLKYLIQEKLQNQLTSQYNRELKNLSLTILSIAAIYWLLVLIYV